MTSEKFTREGGLVESQTRRQWLVGIFTSEMLGAAMREGVPVARGIHMIVEAAEIAADTILAKELVEPADHVGQPIGEAA